MQVKSELWSNFFYSIFCKIKATDPANVYIPQVFPVNDIPEMIEDFISKYISLFTHFPFMYKGNIAEQLDAFVHSINDEQFKIEYKEIRSSLIDYFEKEFTIYKNIWDSIQVKPEIEFFQATYSPYLMEAIKVYEALTEINISLSINVYLIKHMLKNRGKSIISIQERAIAVSSPTVGVFEPELLFSSLHELAHHFSDKYLVINGFKLPETNFGKEYELREETADFLVELFCSIVKLNFSSKKKTMHLPKEIKDKLNKRAEQLIVEPKILHLGKFSKGITLSTGKLVPVKDIFFLTKDDNTISFFLASLGRVVVVPNKYFISFSPLNFNYAYTQDLIKVGLLVSSEFQYQINNTKKDVSDKVFKKIRLHMTDRCNLRCKYCYLSSGQESKITSITEGFALKMLKDVYEEIPQYLEVEFHGGGEPTLELEEMKKIVNNYRTLVKELRVRLQTNGLFSSDVLDWIVSDNVSVSVSLDGPHQINKEQRTNNEDHFKLITNNIRLMIQKGVRVSTISVITKFNQNKQQEIYDFIKSLEVKAMMFNPVHANLGRAKEEDHLSQQDVDIMEFTKHFIEVKKQSIIDNIYLVSDFMPDIIEYVPRNFQCDACRPVPHVYGNGDVCACTRAYDLGNEIINPFIWFEDGLKVNDNFNFLVNRTTEYMNNCKACMLKWMCAGDCLVQVYKYDKTMRNPIKARCDAKLLYMIEILKWMATEVILPQQQ